MMVPAPEPDLHHGVLERINAGFCVIQVLFEGDRAVDYRSSRSTTPSSAIPA